MIKQQVESRYLAARKLKLSGSNEYNPVEVKLYSTLIGAIQTAEKNTNQAPLSDADCIAIIKKMVNSAKIMAEHGNADALSEIAILEGFLPKSMSVEEIQAAVKTAIAGGATNIGGVIKYFTDNGLNADKKTVSEQAKNML